MSQLHSSFGRVANSSGRARRGWVSWLRRSPASPAWARIRYMVRSEASQTPSSSRVATTSAGAVSQNRSESSTARTAWRSASDRARGGGGGGGGGGGRGG